MGIEISGMVMLQISGKILERESFVFCFISLIIQIRLMVCVLDAECCEPGVRKVLSLFKLHFL